MDINFQPITSTNARGHYRQHSLEFKRALVARSLEPGASVARIAREHGVNANQVFSWRRLCAMAGSCFEYGKKKPEFKRAYISQYGYKTDR